MAPRSKSQGSVYHLLVAELVVRWLIAIVQKRHYRWFFFPFVHWYEVLGCAPQLRALRLLRVGVIGYRLHELGYKVLPASWLATIKFYYQMIMEEISDRVILTAIDNIRTGNSNADGQFGQNIIDKHRDDIQRSLSKCCSKATPLLQSTPQSRHLCQTFGRTSGHRHSASADRYAELHRILRLIPIAGSLMKTKCTASGNTLGKSDVKAWPPTSQTANAHADV